MLRFRISRGSLAAALVAGGLLRFAAAAPPVYAVHGSVTISTTPAPASGWVLASAGVNTLSGGSIAVTADVAYTLKVRADQTRMTEYVTASAAYASPNPRALGSPLSITAGVSAGAGVPSGTVVLGIADQTLATGLGVGADTYALTLSQPTAITDPALPTGRTYHLVLTYTATATI